MHRIVLGTALTSARLGTCAATCCNAGESTFAGATALVGVHCSMLADRIGPTATAISEGYGYFEVVCGCFGRASKWIVVFSLSP